MTENIARSVKKSDFTEQASVPAGSTFDYVYNGTNYKITYADMVAAFGTVGTLSQLGDSLQTPILKQTGAINEIRNLEDGAGVKASISANGGAQLDHNFTVDDTGVPIMLNPAVASPTLVSLVAGSGMNVSASGDTIQIAISATPASTKTVIVNELTDLPAASLGVRTLADDTLYFFTNDLSTADRFVLGSHTVIAAGDCQNVQLTYTGVGTMFTFTNVTVKIISIALECASGTLIAGTAATDKEFFLENCKIEDVDTFGSLSGFKDIVIANTDIEEVSTGGLTLAGSNEIMNIRDNIINHTGGTLFDLGTATFDGISILNNAVALGAGTTMLSGAASSANLNTGGLATVWNNKEYGAGTALSTISEDDTFWNFQGNNSIPDSITSILSTQAGSTVTIAGTDTPVIIGATWTSTHTSRFTGTAGGRFTYIGKGAHVSINVVISAELDSGEKNCTFYIFKNGSEVTASGIQRALKSGDAGSISLVWQENMATDDYLELFVENNENTEDVIIHKVILGIS